MSDTVSKGESDEVLSSVRRLVSTVVEIPENDPDPAPDGDDGPLMLMPHFRVDDFDVEDADLDVTADADDLGAAGLAAEAQLNDELAARFGATSYNAEHDDTVEEAPFIEVPDDVASATVEPLHLAPEMAVHLPEPEVTADAAPEPHVQHDLDAGVVAALRSERDALRDQPVEDPRDDVVMQTRLMATPEAVLSDDSVDDAGDAIEFQPDALEAEEGAEQATDVISMVDEVAAALTLAAHRRNLETTSPLEPEVAPQAAMAMPEAPVEDEVEITDIEMPSLDGADMAEDQTVESPATETPPHFSSERGRDHSAEIEASLAAMSHEAAPAPEDQPEPDAEEEVTPILADSGLDRDALREIVKEVLHEELRGEIGVRITRNVRTLIRREIDSLIAAEELGD